MVRLSLLVLLLAMAGCAVVPGALLPVDVTVTVDSVGIATAWQVVTVDGGTVGNPMGNNPDLVLEIGTRYRIVNQVGAFHPFELLTLGASPGDDVVLLSEKDSGSFEADPDVDFQEEAGSVSFTLTPPLAAALSGYRCGIHTQNMRGVIDTVATP